MSAATAMSAADQRAVLARSVRTDLHSRRNKAATPGERSVFIVPDREPIPAPMVRSFRTFSGAGQDYLPKPDNDPAQIAVEDGDFVMPSLAEINAARLEVERYKARLLDAPQAPHAGGHQ